MTDKVELKSLQEPLIHSPDDPTPHYSLFAVPKTQGYPLEDCRGDIKDTWGRGGGALTDLKTNSVFLRSAKTVLLK